MKRFKCVFCEQVVELPDGSPLERSGATRAVYPRSVEAGFNGYENTVRCARCPLGPDMDVWNEETRAFELRCAT